MPYIETISTIGRQSGFSKSIILLTFFSVEINLDGGITTRVVDLTGVDLGDRHRRFLFG